VSNYLTLEQLRTSSQLGDLPVDDFAQIAIDSAEEAIEAYCGRRFWKDSGGTAVRYFSADDSYCVVVDDLVTAGTVATDNDGDGVYETTWDATAFSLSPINAAAKDKPYTRILTTPLATQTFPSGRNGVKVTGDWGWPSIPQRVVQATLIQATRFFKRARSSPMGIETVTIDGQPVRIRAKLDADVEVMLSSLIRNGAA
jgi:hypothetical protein